MFRVEGYGEDAPLRILIEIRPICTGGEDRSGYGRFEQGCCYIRLIPEGDIVVRQAGIGECARKGLSKACIRSCRRLRRSRLLSAM
jgi:hypothetical protein